LKTTEAQLVGEQASQGALMSDGTRNYGYLYKIGSETYQKEYGKNKWEEINCFP